jgi:hypothetical protein
MPLAKCRSVDNSPAIDSPDNKPDLREEIMKYDLSGQSTPWPIATKEHPLLFISLVHQDADIKVK